MQLAVIGTRSAYCWINSSSISPAIGFNRPVWCLSNTVPQASRSQPPRLRCPSRDKPLITPARISERLGETSVETGSKRGMDADRGYGLSSIRDLGLVNGGSVHPCHQPRTKRKCHRGFSVAFIVNRGADRVCNRLGNSGRVVAFEVHFSASYPETVRTVKRSDRSPLIGLAGSRLTLAEPASLNSLPIKGHPNLSWIRDLPSSTDGS